MGLKQIKDELFTWDEHYERGSMLALVVAFIYFTLKGEPDANLSTVYYQGNTPYGVLWTWMNPLYWTNLPYTLILAAEVGVVFAFYLWLIKKKRLNKVVVYLNFYTIVFFELFHAHQNITTVMLAPLITITPLVLIPMILQRIPFGWSLIPWDNIHWWCAFGGNGNGYDNQINPCLTVATKLNFFHVYSMAYWITVIWTIYPLTLWLVHRYPDKYIQIRLSIREKRRKMSMWVRRGLRKVWDFGVYGLGERGREERRELPISESPRSDPHRTPSSLDTYIVECGFDCCPPGECDCADCHNCNYYHRYRYSDRYAGFE